MRWFIINNIKKLFVVCLHVGLASAQTCLPSYHNVFTNKQTYELLGRKDFTPTGNDAGHFLPMVLDRKRNLLIIGAKDYIYYVDSSTLVEKKAQEWKSDQQKLSSCRSTLKSADSCSNYIHFLVIHGDKLFVCGTNSLSPKYKLISLENLSVVKEKAAYEMCSSRRDLTMVGELTDMGELISGSYTDFYQKQPVISGIFVVGDGQRQRQKLITDRNVHLKQPEFISSVNVGDSVYIFVMEKAIEDSDSRTATVVRICKGDNGGSTLIGSDRWTTFRKSRLECVISKGSENFVFQNLVHVVYDSTKNVFYAAYTMFKHLNMHSAVCAFKRESVDATFSGNFLETRKGFQNIYPVPNGNFLDGCNVNPANLSRNAIPSEGKQPTNYLKKKALTKAMQYVLMDRKVYSSPEIFKFMQTGVSFTQLALLQTPGAANPVLNIGTSKGAVLMVYKNSISNPCIIKEIATDVGAVQTLLINENKQILYVGSYTKVISLDLYSCAAHSSKDLCIQAHNPLCGWSQLQKKCIPAINGSSVEQDLTKCSRRMDYFGQWSKWAPCEFSTKKYCLCRSRSCNSCNTSICDSGLLFEVKNCSSNAVNNVSEWLQNGAIDGGWSEWSEWSSCNNNQCGNKTMSKNRTCTSPVPANGGKDCIGDSFQCRVCPEKVVLIDTIWSGWSSWGDCFKTMAGSYIMNRTRACSKLNGCAGLDIKILPCTPEGIKWGPWSICSCPQRVRHRLPVLINGCSNCTFLTYPQYQVCEPETDCFTTAATITTGDTTTTLTTEQETTEQDVTTNEKSTTRLTTKDTTTASPVQSTVSRICTPVPMQTEVEVVANSEKTTAAVMDDQTEKTTEKSTEGPTEPPPRVVELEMRDSCDNIQNQFSLQQLIIILTVVIVTCFFVCALIVYLILKRTKPSEKIVINGRPHSNSDRVPLKKGDFSNPMT